MNARQMKPQGRPNGGHYGFMVQAIAIGIATVTVGVKQTYENKSMCQKNHRTK